MIQSNASQIGDYEQEYLDVRDIEFRALKEEIAFLKECVNEANEDADRYCKLYKELYDFLNK